MSTFTVPWQDKTFVVTATSRTFDVPSQDKVFVVPART